MRLSYCYPTPERIREGVRRLAGVLESEMELRATFGASGPPASWAAQRLRRPEQRPDQTETAHDPHPTGPHTRSPRRGRVLVLAGGLSHERDVSLRSGRRVAEALRGTGIEVEERDVDAALLPRCAPRPAGLRGADAARRDRRGRRDPGGPRAARPALRRRPARRRAASPSTSRSRRPSRPRAGIRTPASVCLPHETFRELGAAAVMERWWPGWGCR